MFISSLAETSLWEVVVSLPTLPKTALLLRCFWSYYKEPVQPALDDGLLQGAGVWNQKGDFQYPLLYNSSSSIFKCPVIVSTF